MRVKIKAYNVSVGEHLLEGGGGESLSGKHLEKPNRNN